MIVAAAIKQDGRVWFVDRPGRHDGVIRLMMTSGVRTPIDGVRGFMTDRGAFLTRPEALEHARACKQVTGKLTGGPLTSEDLW